MNVTFTHSSSRFRYTPSNSCPPLLAKFRGLAQAPRSQTGGNRCRLESEGPPPIVAARCDEALFEQLTRAAASNARSVSSEMRYRVQRSFEDEQRARRTKSDGRASTGISSEVAMGRTA